jgi:hypothetical protein
MSNERALKTLVADTLTAIVPLGSPACFREVLSAWSAGSGRRKVVTADLIMFDGERSTVELRPFKIADADGWSVQWKRLDAGAFYLLDGEWKRAPVGEAQEAA